MRPSSNTHSKLKDFTRGGQTLLHQFRMVGQIINRVLLACLLFFIVVSGSILFALTTAYQRYVIMQCGWATVWRMSNEKARQSFRYPDGSVRWVQSAKLLQSPFVRRTQHEVGEAAQKAFLGGSAATFLFFIIVSLYLRQRGRQQSETVKRRGDELVDKKTLNQLLRRSTSVSDIQLGGLNLPERFEVRHLLVHGTIGSGKSVLIKQLLDQIKARGERAIIYDKGCDYVRHYYREGKDIILNPLDERGASWHLWHECRDRADFDSMAAVLMPLPSGNADPFWIHAARTVFAASARQLDQKKDRSLEQLLQILLTADLANMGQFLQGTEAATLVSDKIEKMAMSIKSVLITALKSLLYVKDGSNAFSIREWVRDDKADNWLFVSSLADRHEAIKPIITLWLDIVVNALMSLPPSQDRRIWIILDELPTLNKLPCLIHTLAEARKFGGCLVAGVQSIAQLRETYGFHGAESIAGLCNTKWFFRSPTFDTANWVSRELGQAELEEVREGISYGETAMRSGISIAKHQANRQVVAPSDIMKLPDLEAYVRLVGGFPITKASMTFKKQAQIAEPFIARNITETNTNKMDSLVKSAENRLPSAPVQLKKPEKEEMNLQW